MCNNLTYSVPFLVSLNLTNPSIFYNAAQSITFSCQLLLDEEGPQVRKLPCTGDAQNDQLNQRPSHNPCVGRLRLISEFRFTLLHHYQHAIQIKKYLTPKNNRKMLTLWKTCSRLMSCNLPFKSLTLFTISWILPLSVLSIALVSPIAKSSVNLMPPMGWRADSQPVEPEFEEGVKQILWSPDSAALKVKRPDEEPFCETTRWSLSNTSLGIVNIYSFSRKTKRDRGRTYINGDEDIQPIMLGPYFPVIVVFFCCVMADHQSILREFLEETFRRCAVDVEV